MPEMLTENKRSKLICTEIQLSVNSYDDILKDHNVHITRITKIDSQKLIRVWGIVTDGRFEAKCSQWYIKKTLESAMPGYTAEVSVYSQSGIYKSRNWI